MRLSKLKTVVALGAAIALTSAVIISPFPNTGKVAVILSPFPNTGKVILSPFPNTGKLV